MKQFTEEEKNEYLAAIYADPGRFCREVLSDWFPLKMPWVHRGILALILRRPEFLLNFGEETWAHEIAEWTVDDLRMIEKYFLYDPEKRTFTPDSPTGVKLFQIEWEGDTPVSISIVVSDYTMIVMPRGFSKTTLMNAAILFLVLFQDRSFIVYISETIGHASAQLSNVKNVLRENLMVLALWGNILPDRSDPEINREEELKTLTGIHLVARGRGGQVRGLNRDGKRPDLILFDDVEDEESVKTPEQRQKCIKWFKGAVEPARREIGDTYFFGLGTMLHPEALLPTLLKDPEWLSVVFGAMLADGTYIWPRMMDEKKLLRKKRSYAITGTLSTFYLEYLSIFKSDDTAKFKLSYIKHDWVDPQSCVARALAIDPAISEKVGASVCAFGVVGITEAGRIVVLHCSGEAGMTPRQQVDKYFQLHFDFDCTHHGVESIAYQRALIHLLTEEMFRKGKTMGPKAYFEITPLTHGAVGKEERVLGVLQPRYAAGYVTHNIVFPELETALLDWPMGKMDYPDVVAQAVSLLDPFASLASETDEAWEGDALDDIEDLTAFRSAP